MLPLECMKGKTACYMRHPLVLVVQCVVRQRLDFCCVCGLALRSAAWAVPAGRHSQNGCLIGVTSAGSPKISRVWHW